MKKENKNSALRSLATEQCATSPIEKLKKTNLTKRNDMIAEIKPMTKKEVFLTTLVNQGANGLNTFEANAIYGDTCLHSEISALGKEHNIIACREWEKLTNPHKTRCMRYWLADDDMPRAKQLVNFIRVERGEKPLYREAE